MPWHTIQQRGIGSCRSLDYKDYARKGYTKTMPHMKRWKSKVVPSLLLQNRSRLVIQTPIYWSNFAVLAYIHPNITTTVSSAKHPDYCVHPRTERTPHTSIPCSFVCSSIMRLASCPEKSPATNAVHHHHSPARRGKASARTLKRGSST